MDEVKDIPVCHCPHCNGEMDGAASLDGSGTPEPGSVGLCAYCGELMVYRGPGEMGKITDEELAKVQSDPVGWAQLQQAQAYLKAIPRWPGWMMPDEN